MDNKTYTGILKKENSSSYLELADGKRIFEDEPIWSGYLKHWNNQHINARRLDQLDYEFGKPIIIMWPVEPKPKAPFVQRRC